MLDPQQLQCAIIPNSMVFMRAPHYIRLRQFPRFGLWPFDNSFM